MAPRIDHLLGASSAAVAVAVARLVEVDAAAAATEVLGAAKAAANAGSQRR